MEEKEADRGLTVFISTREAHCGECTEDLGRTAWITLDRAKGAVCLSCADMDHLLFLEPGDPALTRRSKKYSKLSAVVLKWSRARRRYERQGLLVEQQALEQAEAECLSDAAKELEEHPVRLAVIAHIRHTETHYDTLLTDGLERSEARHAVADRVNRVLEQWSGAKEE